MTPSDPLLSTDLRAFISTARVGRLATVNARQQPVVVPICFALLETDRPEIVSILDEKPKRVADGELARVRNIRQNPAVCLLIDEYHEEWSQLAFAQIHGEARIIVAGDNVHTLAIANLRQKYSQYLAMNLDHRPVIAIRIDSVTSWSGSAQRADASSFSK